MTCHINCSIIPLPIRITTMQFGYVSKTVKAFLVTQDYAVIEHIFSLKTICVYKLVLFVQENKLLIIVHLLNVDYANNYVRILHQYTKIYNLRVLSMEIFFYISASHFYIFMCLINDIILSILSGTTF